jgi:hypothetical protein
MNSFPFRLNKYLIAALALATLLKLYLALITLGSADVLAYEDYLIKIRSLGGIGTYYAGGSYGNPFNVPPLNIAVIKVMGWFADITGLPFRFWLRLPCIVADIGSFFVVWLLLGSSAPKTKTITFILFALCPASIMISGFHGNSDPVMIFFVLLTISLVEKRHPVWLAAIALGLAMSIKVVPLIFLPAFIFYLPTIRQKVNLLVIAGVVFVVGTMPYIFQDPRIIIEKVFGYGSFYGVWGWTSLLSPIVGPNLDSSQPMGSHEIINRIGKLLLLASILTVSLWMNRRNHKQPLFVQCGVVSLLFMFLTPGFGVQYLSWTIPFVVYLGLWPALMFYATSSIFLFIDYHCWAYGPTQPYYCHTKIPSLASLACWMSVIVVLMIYRRKLKERT